MAAKLPISKGIIPLRPDQIHTLIFMDFETTGMIPETYEKGRPTPGDRTRSIAHMVTRNCNIHDNPKDMPQITEMAFVAVPRQLFASAVEDIHGDALFDEDGPLIKKIPSNIYASQIKPILTFNQWRQYEETRKTCSAMHLSEMDLKYKNTLTVEWPAVHAFLKCQKPPAIIIAHNGANFDYRILYSELVRNQLLQDYPIPDGIYFMDSYLAFLDIEKQHLDNLAITTNSINWDKLNGIVGLAKETTCTSVAEDEEEETATRNVEDVLLEESADIFSPEILPQSSRLRPENSGMRTPPPQKRKAPFESRSVDYADKGKRRLIFDGDEEEVLPYSFLNKSNWSPAKKRRIQKSFFKRTSETNWEFNSVSVREYFLKGNFKLESLYKQVVKSTYNAHHALDDCHALMQVSLAYGDDFLNYMESRKEKIPILYGNKRFPTAASNLAPTVKNDDPIEVNQLSP